MSMLKPYFKFVIILYVYNIIGFVKTEDDVSEPGEDKSSYDGPEEEGHDGSSAGEVSDGGAAEGERVGDGAAIPETSQEIRDKAKEFIAVVARIEKAAKRSRRMLQRNLINRFIEGRGRIIDYPANTDEESLSTLKLDQSAVIHYNGHYIFLEAMQATSDEFRVKKMDIDIFKMSINVELDLQNMSLSGFYYVWSAVHDTNGVPMVKEDANSGYIAIDLHSVMLKSMLSGMNSGQTVLIRHAHTVIEPESIGVTLTAPLVPGGPNIFQMSIKEADFIVDKLRNRLEEWLVRYINMCLIDTVSMNDILGNDNDLLIAFRTVQDIEAETANTIMDQAIGQIQAFFSSTLEVNGTVLAGGKLPIPDSSFMDLDRTFLFTHGFVEDMSTIHRIDETTITKDEDNNLILQVDVRLRTLNVWYKFWSVGGDGAELTGSLVTRVPDNRIRLSLFLDKDLSEPIKVIESTLKETAGFTINLQSLETPLFAMIRPVLTRKLQAWVENVLRKTIQKAMIRLPEALSNVDMSKIIPIVNQLYVK